MTRPLDLKSWLRTECAKYRFDIAGVLQRNSDQARWPVHAETPDELHHQLKAGGHLLPLPKESAALANVLEVSIVDFLVSCAEHVDGITITQGTDRGYPDIEFSGPAFGGGFHAVDVKAARRDPNGKKTQSRITLYTGNTYFRWPKLHWPGVPRAFDDYESHLDLLMIYTLDADSLHRVEDLEILVQEPWRIASRDRSSTTREYIGAVECLQDLRDGVGAFSSPAEFYSYWRQFDFKISKQVQKKLDKLLREQSEELERLRAAARGRQPDQ